MARVYRLPAVVQWNTPGTPAAFFASSALLGALTVGASLALAKHRWFSFPGVYYFFPMFEINTPLVWIGFFAILILTAKIVYIILRLKSVGKNEIQVARMALQLAAAIILLTFLTLKQPPPILVGVLFSLAFGCAIVAEILGRLLFYQAPGQNENRL